MLLAAIFAAVACGGSGQGGGDQSNSSETTGNASSPRTLPEQEPLSAGKYRTKTFEPEFSFEVGEGWEVAGQFDESASIARGGDTFLSFSSPRKVYDSKEPGDQREIAAPETVDEWVAWYRANPHLDFAKLEPVTLGDASGVRFETTVTSAPDKATDDCGVPCVPGYPIGPTAVVFYLEDQQLNYVLKVGDETLDINIAAPPDQLEAFLPEAQKVLDTVEWNAGS